MHFIGGTVMKGQNISWNDTKDPKLRCETIRTHVFPFVSYSDFYAHGYAMLKDYYIALPPSRTYRFIDYLMFLWTEDQIDEVRASHSITRDPIERAKVHDMDEKQYQTYWQEQVRKLHRRVPKSREAFLALSHMDENAMLQRVRDLRKQCRKDIRSLRKSLDGNEWFSYQISLRWWQIRNAFTSSLVIALIAVSLAEIVKMFVSHWLHS